MRVEIVSLCLTTGKVICAGGESSKFDAGRFIDQCRRTFPDAVLSLGWTTRTLIFPWNCIYTVAMVDEVGL